MSELIKAPTDLSVSGTPSELMLTVMGIQPNRIIGKTVLDVASGCSDVVHRLNEAGAAAYGIDPGYQDLASMYVANDTFNLRNSNTTSPSKAPFRAANDRFREDIGQNPSRYIAASAESLPFRSGSVDLILNNLFLVSAEPDEAYFNATLQEWARVMRKGGEAFISLFPGQNSTVPTETRAQMNDSKRLIKSIGEAMVRTKKIRKISERSHPIGNIVILSK